jgi:glycerophosphoryl diester phosphodiesterase
MELARRQPGSGALVVAHRGAWSKAPQNSLQALEDAIALGCEMAEIDVRSTRDGHLVVVHDARVRGVPVAAQDLGELRARVALGQAPLLHEMVELAAGRIALDVELKDSWVAPALATLARHLEPESYIVTSFLDAAVRQAGQADPRVRTGLLVRPGRPPRRLEARLAQTGASLLGLPAALARAGLLAWAANRELASFVWTVNDQRALRSLLADQRVSAVVTDRPELALELRRRAA